MELTSKEKKRILNEVKMLKKIEHPTIIRLVDHFEENHNLYIAMEFAESIKNHNFRGRSCRTD